MNDIIGTFNQWLDFQNLHLGYVWIQLKKPVHLRFFFFFFLIKKKRNWESLLGNCIILKQIGDCDSELTWIIYYWKLSLLPVLILKIDMVG